MINYIKADFYRMFKKKSLYIFLGICSLGFILSNILVSSIEYTEETFIGLSMILLTFVPIFVGLFVFNIVYVDDLRSKSLQTAIGFGKKRSEIVIVKYIDALILMLVFTVLIILHLFIVPTIFGLSLTEASINILMGYVASFFLKTIGYFALASIAVFFFQKTTSATTVYILLSTGTINILMSLLLSQSFIIKTVGDLQPYLYTEVVNNMLNALQLNTGNIMEYIVLILAYIIGSIVLSSILFNRKELEF